jgi:stage II sporulation protein AA (anti-sigma F factor antagonist)
VPSAVPLPHPDVAHARPFCCTCTRTGRTIRIVVSGELDIATVPVLDSALRSAGHVAALIVVDLRDLEFIDSSGAQLLLTADRSMREAAGGRMLVVRGSYEVDWLLGLLGFDRELELVDESQAIATVADPALRDPAPA